MIEIEYLIKEVNRYAELHSLLKEQLIQDSYHIDELQKKLNDNLDKLTEYENKYVALIERISEITDGKANI
mgnify:CR=1 FL=1